MNSNDRQAFNELMDGLSEYYQKDKLNIVALGIYFDALARFEFDQIAHAAGKHVQSSSGQFYPKAADFIRHIEGHGLTHDQVISAARLAKTPLGVLCRIHIGHWDLEHQSDMFYLKQRAQECLQLIPEWKARALSGEYSDHEISILLKYKVDPTAPVHDGLPAPSNRRALADRAREVSNSRRHQFLLEKPHDSEEEPLQASPNIRKFITQEMAD
jgi:hypothetical protein